MRRRGGPRGTVRRRPTGSGPPAPVPGNPGRWQALRRSRPARGRWEVWTGGRGHPDQQRKGDGRGGPAGQRGQRVRRPGRRAVQRGRHPDRREADQAEQPVPELAHGQRAHDRGEHGQYRQDPGDQDHLVVGAEGGDREVLHRRRGEIDRGFADGHHGRAVRGHDAGDKLAHADRRRGGKQSRDHPPARSRPVHLRSHASLFGAGRRVVWPPDRSSPARYTGTCGAAKARPRTKAKPAAGRLRI